MTSKITLSVIKEYLEKKRYFSPIWEPVAFNGNFKAYRTNRETCSEVFGYPKSKLHV
jgi:hypothetical protein